MIKLPLNVTFFALLLCLSTSVFAQSSEEILRLEDTIRGNKEQPQVFTIVPWQLPSHQRIDETRAWQPVIDKLAPIERSRFLKDLSVIANARSDGTNLDEGDKK
uniref:hypothetical protein n=1 Tax=Ningiella ruwaisensis TaxID=2364274 RepID=UPI00109F663D|nr:hypothetical protein [Ningiella ruwaisensis]